MREIVPSSSPNEAPRSPANAVIGPTLPSMDRPGEPTQSYVTSTSSSSTAWTFTSWRSAIILAVVVSTAMMGLKFVFGPSPEERIAAIRQRIAESRAGGNVVGDAETPIERSNSSAGTVTSLFGNGMPAAFADRKIVAGLPLRAIGLTLPELLSGFDTQMTTTFEPIMVDRLIVRVVGVDRLTHEPLEYAMDFVAVDGPELFGATAEFQGAAIVFNDMAFNQETMTPAEAIAVLTILRNQASMVLSR